jgi:hypothetical protein
MTIVLPLPPNKRIHIDIKYCNVGFLHFQYLSISTRAKSRQNGVSAMGP